MRPGNKCLVVPDLGVVMLQLRFGNPGVDRLFGTGVWEYTTSRLMNYVSRLYFVCL